jgi:uncharacterized protein YqeY
VSALRDKINEAYKAAMKGRDEIGIRAIRFLNADIRKLEVDERRDASEADLLAIIQRGIKRRRETIDVATSQQRQDIVDAEAAELKVLQQFLPQQLSEPELVALIDATIAETGATQKKEQGKVMSALMPKLQGRADGKLVAKLVGERLK